LFEHPASVNRYKRDKGTNLFSLPSPSSPFLSFAAAFFLKLSLFSFSS
jgi:hypothetical protein